MPRYRNGIESGCVNAVTYTKAGVIMSKKTFPGKPQMHYIPFPFALLELRVYRITLGMLLYLKCPFTRAITCSQRYRHI